MSRLVILVGAMGGIGLSILKGLKQIGEIA